MTQPKAKWSRYEDEAGVWTAAVGFHYLEVNSRTGRCEISEWEPESASIGGEVWEHFAPTPCDAPDLMRLTESELARRLEEAAETMRGEGLVARTLKGVRDEFVTLPDGSKTSDDVFGDTPASNCEELIAWGDKTWGDAADEAGPCFKVGDRVVGVGVLDGTRRAGIVTNFRYGEYDVVFDDGLCQWSPAETLVLEATRFKVGDLVRSRNNPTAVGTIVDVRTTNEGRSLTRILRTNGSQLLALDPTPYVLPPINSYTDLADVLDELPEGWRVLVHDARGASSTEFRRVGTMQYQVRSGYSAWKSADKQPLDEAYPTSTHEILPPEFVK